ncbi:hypothetical protein [Dysgonomonas sp. 511]|uniref:hypothetical protein n=1 Tax=Dysgonomonas sp. 511 TaxID=2302930 RepID=UPI0013D560FC|nr:hypothetical protein [Dysgonomonas sp. 511]NDV78430.1 hypothetical protein [Dysgonomonas sp. 511]
MKKRFVIITLSFSCLFIFSGCETLASFGETFLEPDKYEKEEYKVKDKETGEEKIIVVEKKIKKN